MTTTFELSITMGNAAMEDGSGVARALEVVAARVLPLFADELRDAAYGIYDINGNRVGQWAFKTEPEHEAHEQFPSRCECGRAIGHN